MKIKYLIPAFALLVLVGCQNDEVPPPEIEVFSGELAVANIKQTPPYTYPDTGRVIFTVEGGTYKLVEK